MDQVPYELALMEKATNYQNWVSDSVRPFLGNRILEVGAGTGNLSQHLPVRELLVLSEYDAQLREKLKAHMKGKLGEKADEIRYLSLDLGTTFRDELYDLDLDTIVSFNVLEHIESDTDALDQFAEVLSFSRAKGPKRILIFVPAHQWAYGSLDSKFGHYRRSYRKRIQDWASTTSVRGNLEVRYFNLLGLAPWYVMNRILKVETFNPNGVDTFEKICPYVRGADDFIHNRLKLPFGQSLLAVWTLKTMLQ